MRQNVIFSTLAVAVAPVAAMAEGAVYQNVTDVQAVAADTKGTILETKAAVDKMSDYKFYFKSDVAAAGSKIYVNDVEQDIDIKAGTNIVEVPPTLTDPGALTLKVKPSVAVNISAVQLIPADLKYDGSKLKEVTAGVNKMKDFLAAFKAEVETYINKITGEGYTPSDPNNTELTLLKCICDPGDKEFTVANFERFELYSGNLDKIKEDFVETMKSVEAEELAKNEIAADDLATLPQEIQDDIAEAKKALEDATTPEEAQKAKDQLKAAQDYGQFLLVADKVKAALDAYETQLNGYKTPATFNDETNEGGYALGIYQIEALGEAANRLAGVKAVYEKFIADAATAYDSDNGKFEAPKDIKTQIEYKGSPTDTEEYATIEELLGKDLEPALARKGEKGVLNKIAFMTYSANQYQAQFDNVLKAAEKAQKVFDEQLQQLDLNFLKYSQYENPNAPEYYKDVLEQVRTKLLKDFVKEGGIKTVMDEAIAAKKAGEPISYVTNHGKSVKQGFGLTDAELTGYDWTAYVESEIVPAQLWVAQLTDATIGVAGKVTTAVADWNAKVDAAYNEYTKEWTSIYGNTDTPANCLQYLIESLNWAGVADDVKKVKDGTLTLDEIYQDIVADQQGMGTILLTKITRALIGDPITGFEITDGDWATNWLDGTFDTSNDEGGYASYTNLLDRLGALKTKVDAAKAEYQAYQDLLAAADGLLTRLEVAKDDLDTKTAALDPAYEPSGYLDELTAFVTNVVTALKAAAKTAYGDGTGTGAQTMLAGDAYKTQDVYDSNDDDTPDKDWTDADTAVKRVEATGDIDAAVDKFVTFYGAIAADKALEQAFLDKVKDHAIYTTNNEKYGSDAKRNKYKDNDEAWLKWIKEKGSDQIDAAFALDDDAHFAFIDGLVYTQFDIEAQLNMTETTVDDEIAKDKLAYDTAALKERVMQLFNSLYGDNGYAEGGSDGKIDDARTALEAGRDAYKKLLDSGDPDDVFGSTTAYGDATTLAAAWGATKYEGIGEIVEKAHKALKNISDTKLGTATTLAEWDDINNSLQLINDWLDAFMDDGTAANYNTIVVDETTCVQKLLDLTKKMADNKAAYDAILAKKGELSKTVDDILKALKDNYEKTEEGDKLIKTIEDTYKPIPSAYAAQIEDTYQNGTAVADGPDGKKIEDADGNVIFKPIYMILDEALDAVKALYTDWDGSGYMAAIAAENAQTFANEIGANYDAALDRYNQMVADMKDFKAPKDPKLLEAYNAAFKAANDEIFDVPYELKDLKAKAATHKDEADADGKHYDATADKNLILAQQAKVQAAYDTFVAALKTAVANRWADLNNGTDGYEKQLQDAYDAIKGKYIVDDASTPFGTKYPSWELYFVDLATAIATADSYLDFEYPLGVEARGEFLAFDALIIEGGDLYKFAETLKTNLNAAANTDLLARIAIQNKQVAADEKKLKEDGLVAKNGKKYTYKELLGDTKFNEFVAQFEEIVANSVGAANTKRAEFDSKNQLPDFEVDGKKSYDIVKALIDAYDATDFFTALDAACASALEAGAYFDLADEFYGPDSDADGVREKTGSFFTDRDGILSMYVGPQFAAELDALEKELEAQLKKEPDYDALKAIVDKMEKFDDKSGLIYRAKDKEYKDLKDELSKMKAEYNELIGKVYADPKDKDKHDALVDQFDNPAKAEYYIDGNLTDLDDYEGFLNTLGDQTDDKDYPDYVALESNVAKIKTQLCIEIGIADPTNELAQTAESLKQMVKDLRDKLDALKTANAAYENPDFLADTDDSNDYLTNDFGLFQNYLQGTRYKYHDYEDLMKLIDGVQSQLDVVEKSVSGYESAADGYGNVLLYNENLKKQLAAAEAKIAANDAQSDVYKANNQGEIDMAAQQLAWKNDLAAAIKAVEDLIEPAEQSIEALGAKVGKDLKGDFTAVQQKLQLVTERLEAVYQAAALTAGTELNNDKAAWTANAYKDAAVIYVPAIDGLNTIKALIAAEVQKFVDQEANAKIAEGKAAYDAAIAKLTSTEMKLETRKTLEGKFYGMTAADEFDGGYQEEYATLRDAKAAQTITTIFDYIDDIDALIAKLTDEETGFIAEVAGEQFGDINNGDGTGDGVVDVKDLQYLINLVTNPDEVASLTKTAFNAADLNSDGSIDVTDLAILLDVMNGKTPKELAEARMAAAQQFTETLSADVVATEGNRMRIAINLNNWRDYFAFQMDVKMPKGMKLVDQSLGERATTQTLYANDWSNKTRIVAFTMGRDVFEGQEGAVLYLDVETDESYNGASIEYSDIVFTTIQSQGVKFQIGSGNATGIMERMANATKETIYNLGGRMMDGLKKGVNIIRGNGKTEKVIKK